MRGLFLLITATCGAFIVAQGLKFAVPTRYDFNLTYTSTPPPLGTLNRDGRADLVVATARRIGTPFMERLLELLFACPVGLPPSPFKVVAHRSGKT